MFVMRKLLSIIFIVFIVFSSFILPNILFAQQDTSNNNAGTNGTTVLSGCLDGVWKGCFNYEELVWIKNMQTTKYTALSIAQDIIYAATYMVWAVLTAVIIRCGLWYIFAARWGKDTNEYRKWLVNGAIWAILVIWAYTIVRLIQYIAEW